ncbi:Hpt domain-containing protein [Sphingorhabdus pulchriflava]|uniref:Hpt domain-containing protein n=1 Tax=Sphingorhabdus pulchriflava TaxID=2292257 RepID=A0A371B2M7_9SPHN|nr:Hpt domain-containing protein [Sphingorhabdus pulchriflava]RDV01767.1 Hpt domain-containing protein [Sphingorhabdus pulchriflava]
MTSPADDIVNWATFGETRSVLGEAFVRVLGYFREDGIKSVATIEQAMRERDSAKLVLPAHTLKGESWQFGAERLAALAEEIEVAARHYVELRQGPEELVEKVVQLRPLFEATLTALENEASPLVERRAQFGARTMGQSQFGRL